MKGNALPPGDHVSRYCKFKSLSETTGLPRGAAFFLREDIKEEYLSVNWLEYFGNLEFEELLQEVRNHIALTPSISAKYAILNIGHTIDYVNKKNHERNIEITHQGTARDPSHSGIWGYNYEDEMIGDLIAQTVISVHPAIAPV